MQPKPKPETLGLKGQKTKAPGFNLGTPHTPEAAACKVARTVLNHPHPQIPPRNTNAPPTLQPP